MKIVFSDMTVSQKRRLFIGILMFFMISGIIAGTILVIIDTEKNYIIKPFFNQYLIKNNIRKTFLSIFSASFLPLELILIFQMVSGFFAIGQPLCAFTLFHRGIAGGISAALIYISYGMKGFFIILIMLLPVLFFNMYILVLGARESIKFSNRLVCFLIGKNVQKNTEIRFYFLKFMVLTFFVIICSALESILTYFFTDLLLKQ